MTSDLFEWAAKNVAKTELRERRKKRRELKGDKNRSAVICRLQQGPLSTFDAERFMHEGRAVHRGQAVIGELRERGYDIPLVTLNGVEYYVYRGYSKRVKVTKSLQDKYYATSHWKETRQQRLEIDLYRCVQCGERDNLEVHHWRYNLFAESVVLDLMTLCHRCHQKIHDAISGSGVHFPRYITADLVSKIKDA